VPKTNIITALLLLKINSMLFSIEKFVKFLYNMSVKFFIKEKEDIMQEEIQSDAETNASTSSSIFQSIKKWFQ
jgi:hypothetical protein